MKTNLSLFGSSSLRGGGRVLDPICTMSLYLPFFGFDGAPKEGETNSGTELQLYIRAKSGAFTIKLGWGGVQGQVEGSG